MKIQNRLFLISLAALAVGGFVYSQIYFYNKTRQDLREIAREIALNWQEKLNLTTQQMLLLEDIIIDFTIKKNEVINANLPGDKKIEKLKKIQKKEHNNLRKFLSEEEFNAYVGINKKIPNKVMDSLSV